MTLPASSLNNQKDRPIVTFIAVLLLGSVLRCLHVSADFLAPTAHYLVGNKQPFLLPTLMEAKNINSSTRVVKNLSIARVRDAITVQSDGENATDAAVAFSRRGANQINISSINDDKSAVLRNNNTLSRLQRKQNHMDKIRNMAPVMCAGLPKTGTTSLHLYFASWRKHKHGARRPYRSSHTYTHLSNGTRLRAGACMQDNLQHGHKMLEACGPFQVWSDSGYADNEGDCFYPLWHALDEFVQQYPYATIILNTRNVTEWTSSIHKWAKGSLARRWNICRTTDLTLPKTLQREEWIQFYQIYHERIRKACKEHATLKCIEFDITDAHAGRTLEANFGIPASQWMHCNPQGMKCNQPSL